MGTFSAAGLSLPPHFVFPYERVPTAVRNSIPQGINKLQDCICPTRHSVNLFVSKGWSYANSKKGWMTQEIFLMYLREHFYPFVKELPEIVFPVLLLVDGATSHISIEVSGTNKDFTTITILNH